MCVLSGVGFPSSSYQNRRLASHSSTIDNMQPSRRSARLNLLREAETNPPPSPKLTSPAASSVIRKYSRKRPRRNLQPTPPPSEVESLSDKNPADNNSVTDDVASDNNSDLDKNLSDHNPNPPEEETEVINQEEAEEGAQEELNEIELIPQVKQFEASRAIFLARSQENPTILWSSRAPISARFLTAAAFERYDALSLRKLLSCS